LWARPFLAAYEYIRGLKDNKSVPVVVDDIQGRVSKWVTNGSKTAVMDVTSFLCVSLGISTV
jgi:hypothetical protein